MIDTNKGFTLTREFDATPAAIYTAWTDPDRAAAWWHPRGSTTPRESVRIDARVGGEYRYTMVEDATGDAVETAGVYRELIENEKLVFTWGSPGDDPDETPVVTVTIESLGELTRMTFDLRGEDGMSGDEYFYDGWDSALDELAAYLGQTGVLG